VGGGDRGRGHDPAGRDSARDLEPVRTAVGGESAALISIIERAARDPSVDIDKFERLMLMKERVDRQQGVQAFNDAISAAKGEIGPIVKNRTVDFSTQKGRTHYKHEDLAAITAVLDPVLKRHGLAYRFRSAQANGKLSVTCILSHVRGHSEETTLETAEDHSGNKNTTQAIGSAATYLQRYTLKLALGLAASQDDDGRAAGSTIDEEMGTLSDKQADEIRTLLTVKKIPIETFLNYMHAESISDIPAKDYDRAKTAIAKSKGGAR
jgi:hypothetical protein